jgi:hypothetical protein
MVDDLNCHQTWPPPLLRKENLTDTLRTIVAKFDSNWFSGFREEDFLKTLQTDDTGLQVMAIAKKYKDLYMYL